MSLLLTVPGATFGPPRPPRAPARRPGASQRSNVGGTARTLDVGRRSFQLSTSGGGGPVRAGGPSGSGPVAPARHQYRLVVGHMDSSRAPDPKAAAELMHRCLGLGAAQRRLHVVRPCHLEVPNVGSGRRAYSVKDGKGNDVPVVGLPNLAQEIFQAVRESVKVLETVVDPFPLVIQVSLHGAAGCVAHHGGHYWLRPEGKPVLQQDPLVSDAVVWPTASVDVYAALRPLLDFFWQALGEPRCAQYDDSGHWKS